MDKPVVNTGPQLNSEGSELEVWRKQDGMWAKSRAQAWRPGLSRVHLSRPVSLALRANHGRYEGRSPTVG